MKPGTHYPHPAPMLPLEAIDDVISCLRSESPAVLDAVNEAKQHEKELDPTYLNEAMYGN